MNTFCVLPWMQVSIKPAGAMTTCCVMKALNKTTQTLPNKHDFDNSRQSWEHDIKPYICGQDSMLDILNADQLKEVRLALLNNIKHPVCSTCWSRERYSNGAISVRVNNNRRWKDVMNYELAKTITAEDGSIDSSNVKSLELRLGNHCNLKCVMCHPGHSDAWYNDWNKLKKLNSYWTIDGSSKDEFMFGGVKYNMNDKTSFEWYKNDLFKEEFKKIYPNLKEIYWAGGEPLLATRHLEILKILVDSGVSKNIQLRYDTNITYIPDKILNLWKEFKWVATQCSVDDINERVEYIRYPVKWNTIKNNLIKLDKHPNCMLTTGVTLSCYNILTFLDFAKWVKNNLSKYTWEMMHFKHVIAPFNVSPSCLPKEVKFKAIEKIEKHLKSDNCPNKDTPHYTKVNMFKNYLIEELDHFNEIHFNGFIEHTKNLDNLRNLQFKKYFPELYQMIKINYNKN